jgi:hypothetical protein
MRKVKQKVELSAQMWTTRNADYRGGPYLIKITRAFKNSDDTYINLNSVCESGSDEYITINELFNTEKEAIEANINSLNLEKTELINRYLKISDKIDNLERKLKAIT